ncbi:MAG: SRPBCC family protein [Ferruginibacter sp.]
MKSNIKGYVSTNIDASINEVWDALTKPEIIKQYFFGTNTETDWKPGHAIKFTGEWEGKTYEDKGTVLDIEKNKLIKYSYWSSMSGIEEKPENYAILTYELAGNDGDVTVSVLQENIPDEKMKAHSEENWNKVLQGLKNLLEKKLKPA